LTLAGHVHHKHSQGDSAVAVHYSVVTEHKIQDGGHKGHEGHLGHEVQHGHGGHYDYDGHYKASHHAWGYDEAHNAGSHYGGHDAGHDDSHYDHHAYPKYDFSYGIKDPKTGDVKSHKEVRDGDSVKGSYTIKEADGTTRHVEYTADKHTGFNAVVHTTGHAHAHVDAAKEHGHTGYDHGYGHAHGQASSFIMVKKQEERKH
ncbi:hypothetical protein DOY81_009068, partial [Sarcophaga bullata]